MAKKLRTPKHAAPVEGPPRLWSTVLPTLLTLGLAGYFILATWPGWLNNDSVGMQIEAETRLFTDWHSPALTWLWSYLQPEATGVLWPYVLQQVAFWVGVSLLVLVSSSAIGYWSLLLPFTIIFSDHIWEIAWLSKDATAVSLITLSLGSFALALFASKGRYRFAYGCIAFGSLGLVTVARWYLLPALLVLLAAYVWALRGRLVTLSTQKNDSGVLKAAALAIPPVFFVLGAVGPAVVERAVIQPQASYHSSSTQLLDLWRASCINENSLSATGRFPPELVTVRSESICSGFNPYIWNEVNTEWLDPKTNRTSARLPQSETEAAALRDAWVEAWVDRPGTLLYARAITTAQLLRLAEYWTTLGPPEKVFGGEARLALARIPMQLMSAGDSVSNVLRNAFLYVILLPVILIVVLRVRKLPVTGWSYVALVFPLAWVANMALVAPAIDTRYVAPAVAASLGITFIVVTQAVTAKRRAGGI